MIATKLQTVALLATKISVGKKRSQLITALIKRIYTSLLRRLQAQTLPDTNPPLCALGWSAIPLYYCCRNTPLKELCQPHQFGDIDNLRKRVSE